VTSAATWKRSREYAKAEPHYRRAIEHPRENGGPPTTRTSPTSSGASRGSSKSRGTTPRRKRSAARAVRIMEDLLGEDADAARGAGRRSAGSRRPRRPVRISASTIKAERTEGGEAGEEDSEEPRKQRRRKRRARSWRGRCRPGRKVRRGDRGALLRRIQCQALAIPCDAITLSGPLRRGRAALPKGARDLEATSAGASRGGQRPQQPRRPLQVLGQVRLTPSALTAGARLDPRENGGRGRPPACLCAVTTSAGWTTRAASYEGGAPSPARHALRSGKRPSPGSPDTSRRFARDT